MSEFPWYRIHRVRKRQGGFRKILLPKWTIWEWVHRHGLSQLCSEAVRELACSARVGDVAHGYHLGRSPVTLARSLFGNDVAVGAYLVQYELLDAFRDIPTVMASDLGKCRDVPSEQLRERVAKAIPELRQYPYPVARNWPSENWIERPETWGVPDVIPGRYLHTDQFYWNNWYVDLLTGLEVDRGGHPRKIWEGPPLAVYAYERYMIPFDVHIAHGKGHYATYRRYHDSLFFLVDEEDVDLVVREVEGFMAGIGLKYHMKRFSRLESSPVNILGLSVDPNTGEVRLAEYTRRRLDALSYAESNGKIPKRLRRVLQRLRALEDEIAKQQ